jgi:hypothetical protein
MNSNTRDLVLADWKERNLGEARLALAQKLVREGATPAEVRRQLAGFDAKKRGKVPDAAT